MFCQCLFQGVEAAVSIHAVGKQPSEHLATEPVHDCHKIEKAKPHRNVLHIRALDLVRTVDYYILQKIGPYLVLRVLLACIRFLIDRTQPHEAHQVSHAMATAFVVVAFHLPNQLT